MKQVKKESDLWPIVKDWLVEYPHLCFKSEINKGLVHTTVIDVIGVKDVGGDLSGEVETIAVEVKKGNYPFAKASGQALAYKVYANRVYLADQRKERFTADQIYIASHLGIGLIQIQNKECKEVLSSPYYKPIERLNLALLENLDLGKCQICDSLFDIRNIELYKGGKSGRKILERAIKDGKGLKFWNWVVAERKRKIGITKTVDEESAERRFICPDCISNFFSQFKLKDE